MSAVSNLGVLLFVITISTVTAAVQVICPHVARGTSDQITIPRPTITGFPDTNAVTYSYSSAGASISRQSLGIFQYDQTSHELSNLQTGTNDISLTASDGQGSRAQCSFTYERTVAISCPHDTSGTSSQITVTRPNIAGFANTHVVTYSYTDIAASGFSDLLTSIPYGQTSHVLTDLQSGTNHITASASDNQGNVAECTFTYERTGCSSSPCMNEGTCYTGNGGSYFCQCTQVFTGSYCENAIDPCIPNPCEFGGVCLAGDSNTQPSFTCTCPSGLTGDTCNSCDSNPCLNGGMCTASNSGYTCTCANGFSGVQCQNDACNPSPCVNSGTCRGVFRTPGYQCMCTSGFTGLRCEQGVCF
ncbi:uncharacterized protein [Amphiura filiformis]|uniref:uncharacterized protein n=1 Tax=Amphiura filiformis TaxID=82378 RepID=UPI003B21E440